MTFASIPCQPLTLIAIPWDGFLSERFHLWKLELQNPHPTTVSYPPISRTSLLLLHLLSDFTKIYGHFASLFSAIYQSSFLIFFSNESRTHNDKLLHNYFLIILASLSPFSFCSSSQKPNLWTNPAIYWLLLYTWWQARILESSLSFTPSGHQTLTVVIFLP